MERRKLELDYIQLFPRTVENGLAPQHVEQSEFVAECRYIEGFGDAWLLHQQKPPILWPMCSLPLTRQTSTRNLAPPLSSSSCMNTSRATSLSSVCWQTSMQKRYRPLGQTESGFPSEP